MARTDAGATRAGSSVGERRSAYRSGSCGLPGRGRPLRQWVPHGDGRADMGLRLFSEHEAGLVRLSKRMGARREASPFGDVRRERRQRRWPAAEAGRGVSPCASDAAGETRGRRRSAGERRREGEGQEAAPRGAGAFGIGRVRANLRRRGKGRRDGPEGVRLRRRALRVGGRLAVEAGEARFLLHQHGLGVSRPAEACRRRAREKARDDAHPAARQQCGEHDEEEEARVSFHGLLVCMGLAGL